MAITKDGELMTAFSALVEALIRDIKDDLDIDDIESKIETAVEEAIENIDFDDKVDVESKVDEAIDQIDWADKVEDALGSRSVERTLKEACREAASDMINDSFQDNWSDRQADLIKIIRDEIKAAFLAGAAVNDPTLTVKNTESSGPMTATHTAPLPVANGVSP